MYRSWITNKETTLSQILSVYVSVQSSWLFFLTNRLAGRYTWKSWSTQQLKQMIQLSTTHYYVVTFG